MRALIVDDNGLIRIVLRNVLQPFGNCEAVADGPSAIAAFEEHPWDLVCLDLQMPEMDGLALLQRLREIERRKKAPQSAKILVVTASDDAVSIQRAAELGADGYLLKPVHRAVFTARLLELMPDLATTLARPASVPYDEPVI